MHARLLLLGWLVTGCADRPLYLPEARDLDTPSDLATHDLTMGDLAAPDLAVDIAAPRLIGPLSTARVTSLRPTLRWALAADSDGAEIDLCRDRACTTPIATFGVDGSSARPPEPLGPGTVFWRARGRKSGWIGTTTSPTWQFFVGRRDAAVDSSYGASPDVDGDGYSELLVGDRSSTWIYSGSPSGPSLPPRLLPGPNRAALEVTGDVNGDGFADVLVGLQLYLGGAGGLVASSAPVVPNDLMAVSWSMVGDWNGDGYADLVVTASATAQSWSMILYDGGSTGFSPGRVVSLGAGWSHGVAAAAGDVNGDGFADVVVSLVDASLEGRLVVYHGGPGGLGSAPATALLGGYGWVLAVCAGDLDGDGRTDLADVFRGDVYLGGPSGVSPKPALHLPPPQPWGNWSPNVLAPPGDLDGDGFDDLFLVTYNVPADEDPAQPFEVHLLRGGVLLSSSSFTRYFTNPANDRNPDPLSPSGAYNVPISGAGDVDGDGRPDWLASDIVAGSIQEGVVYFLRGGPSPSPVTLLPPRPSPSASFGAFLQ